MSSGSAGTGGLTFTSVMAADSIALNVKPGIEASHVRQSIYSGYCAHGGNSHVRHGHPLMGAHKPFAIAAPHSGRATSHSTRAVVTSDSARRVLTSTCDEASSAEGIRTV